ncbi:MAG: Bug family tripartite tricarboxylate transporter substrate binding protein [Hyphomicrobiaceae bacterium]
MRLTRRAATVALVAMAMATGWLSAGTATAQTAYPSKPIQMVIPYPPGASDVLGRKLAVGMGQALGQTIVVVNKPGASTQVASNFVAQAAPDGYTIYMSNAAELAAGPSLFKSLPFNALTDFAPISYVGDAPFVLAAAETGPHKTFAELLAHMKANPGKVKFASYGVQSQNDITARRLNLAAGTTQPVIPYQGGTPAINAVIRDEVQLLFATTIPTRPFILNKQLRPLAIAAEKRVALYPDVPTLRELGYDVVDAGSFALVGPKGMPPDIVKKLYDVLMAELKKPETKEFIDGLGIVTVASTPAEFTSKLTTLTAHWAEFSAKLGIEKQ